MKKALLLLIFISVFFVMEPVFGELDLSNQRILSLDGNLILEFSENSEKITRDKIIKITNLDYGIIKLPTKTIILDHSKINILANSFSIHMDYGIIYAKNNQDGTFKITVLIVENNKFVKDVFSAKIEPISNDILEKYWANRSDSIRESNKEREIVVVKEDKEIIIMEQIAQKTKWRDYFNFDVIVFDPTKNVITNYNSKDGRIEGVIINGTIKDVNGVILKSFNGTTSKWGYYSNSVYIPENININGAFTLDIFAKYLYDDEIATAKLFKEFFVYAPSSSSGKIE